MGTNKMIAVRTVVAADINKAWRIFSEPASVIRWNFASPDWHCPGAVSDFRKGGSFSYRMESRDGSVGFDFSGKFTEIILHSKIAFELDDGRAVRVEFLQDGKNTRVTENFEIEDENSAELQRSGWQAILDNYKKCAEANP